MDDRQWMVTTALGGVFASAFLYMPYVGHLYVFIAVVVLQAAYLGWQDVTVTQSRFGLLTFALGIYVGTAIMGVLLTRHGPGNLWGVAALMGIVPGVIVMFVSRLIRKRR